MVCRHTVVFVLDEEMRTPQTSVAAVSHSTLAHVRTVCTNSRGCILQAAQIAHVQIHTDILQFGLRR